MKLAVVGAGWAGMAAAVTATQAGHTVTVLEAARTVGGRARALEATLPNQQTVTLDNGQHILIGAYTHTLQLMHTVGVNPAHTLLRLPLTLLFPDGQGLALPAWPSPLDALAGMLSARGWSWADKWSLLRASLGWQRSGFVCSAHTTVAQLCQHLTPRVVQTLIEPLCVSALNTPAQHASGQVFLTVLRDSLFGGAGSSNLLLPTTDMASLFPQAAQHWLENHGGRVRLGARVQTLQWAGNLTDATNATAPNAAPNNTHNTHNTQWRVDGEAFDAVVWATSAPHAAAALMESAQAVPKVIANSMHQWAHTAQALQHEAITTVYAYAPQARLSHPMLALHSDAQHPAQVVFDRGQLGQHATTQHGLLAFVVSASTGERSAVQAQVLAQARSQLGLTLEPVQTVVEKRATFACTPGLLRPPAAIAPGLWAAGDYVHGPYPATLEGAVRSGIGAANPLQTS
jgi:hydroxysqualene dehydroxylase